MKGLHGLAAIEALQDSPEISRLLIEAVARSNGRHSFKSLLDELVLGRATLWIRENSVIVSQTVTYPTGARWMSVRIGAGHIRTLQAMMSGLEDYAGDKGLEGVEGATRPGWARVGKRLGYSETHRFVEKRLDSHA